ncbi:MAG: flagellar basal-body MS-ring/collar protein FliF [Terracidiphilus sp.]|jgi:flagellar M-ring protein FliF
MPGSSNVVEQVKQFWRSRTGLQKGLLLGGAGATALMLTLFVRLIASPDYKPLYKDLDPADAQSLATQLDSQNIPHEVSPDGKTVSVPADKLDAARMMTATQGQQHSGRMGFELFDKMSWGQTEFDEKVAYQRALEGELERTIQTLADVQQARVHLVLPTDSVFLDRQRSAKAAVIVRLRHNGLSKDAVVAISRLVSGAVDGLKPEDVSIIDADSERSLGLAHDGPGNDQDEEARLTDRLINTLEPVVGTNAIRASVNVEFDQASTDENDEKYDPTSSALLSMQRSEDVAGGEPIASGVPGTASNIPAAKPAKPAKPAAQQNNSPAAQTSATTSSPSQSSKTESAQYGVNKTITHTITPAGGIRRISAALLVDDAIVRTTDTKGKVTVTRQKRSQDELNRIQELAEAAIGFDAKRGDTISVQNLSFDGNATESDLPAPNLASEVQKTVSDYSSLLRPLSLLGLFLLAYLLVIRPVQKHALRQSELTAGLQPAFAAANAQGLPSESMDAIEVGRRAAQLKLQMSELAKQNPVDTAHAMQSWMREERS